MPLYTDMIMDNFEDYANHHEDDGVIKLQNMPEDASMEQWGAKLQEIADEFICAPRYFLMCWLASYCLDKDLLDDETYTREFPAFTYQREGGRKKFGFQPVSKEYAQNLEEDERDQYIDILSEIAASHSGDKKAEWRGVFRTAFLWHKKKKKIINEITEYAASMNVLLTYYKLEDNLKDDNGLKDKVAYTIYKGRLKSAYEKYPKKAEFIKGQLETLYNLEQENNTNIDLVSNTFGNLMAEIFAYKEDEFEKDLRQIGFNIGKYIYLLDAYEDLEKDYKKGRYNPFIGYIDRREELKVRVDKLISMTLGMVGRRIDNLNLKTNTAIIENIVYSGVYLRYQNILEEGIK